MSQSQGPHQNPQTEVQSAQHERETAKAQCCHQLDVLACEVCGPDSDLEASRQRSAQIQHALVNVEPKLPQGSAELLQAYENNQRIEEPAFDITKLSPKRLRRIVERQQDLSDEIVANTNENSAANQTEKTESNYRARVDALKASGQSNVEIIKALITDPATLESERTKLIKFAQLIEMAEAHEDQVLITAKINVLDLGRFPEPKAFIAFQVFDSPNHKTGFSKAFQEKVAKTLGITKPPKVVAHSDVRKVAQHRKSIVDPKTGEVTEQFIHDSEDNMAEFRPGVGTYINGNRVMLKSVAGELTKDVTGLSNTAIGHMAEAMSFHAALDYFDATGFVETIGGFKFNSLTGDAFSPTKIQLIRKTMSALIGMSEGHDGAVFDARTKMPLIRQQMEILSPTGSLSGWKQNPGAARVKLEELGLHSNGEPNFDRIAQFGALAQSSKLTAHQGSDAINALVN